MSLRDPCLGLRRLLTSRQREYLREAYPEKYAKEMDGVPIEHFDKDGVPCPGEAPEEVDQVAS